MNDARSRKRLLNSTILVHMWSRRFVGLFPRARRSLVENLFEVLFAFCGSATIRFPTAQSAQPGCEGGMRPVYRYCIGSASQIARSFVARAGSGYSAFELLSSKVELDRCIRCSHLQHTISQRRILVR